LAAELGGFAGVVVGDCHEVGGVGWGSGLEDGSADAGCGVDESLLVVVGVGVIGVVVVSF